MFQVGNAGRSLGPQLLPSPARAISKDLQKHSVAWAPTDEQGHALTTLRHFEAGQTLVKHDCKAAAGTSSSDDELAKPVVRGLARRSK
jgi:hypothetical protein